MLYADEIKSVKSYKHLLFARHTCVHGVLNPSTRRVIRPKSVANNPIWITRNGNKNNYNITYPTLRCSTKALVSSLAAVTASFLLTSIKRSFIGWEMNIFTLTYKCSSGSTIVIQFLRTSIIDSYLGSLCEQIVWLDVLSQSKTTYSIANNQPRRCYTPT